MVVLTGKTASGKDAVMAKLLSRFPNLKRVVTTTSRVKRAGEKAGVDYNFLTEPDFRRKIENGEFLEYVEYGGNLYGTEKAQFERSFKQDLIWRIDPSMAGKARDLINNFKLLVIYLTVDDETVLKRLQNRGLDTRGIEKRMQDDRRFWQEFKGSYDFVVENIPGKLDETVNQISSLIETYKEKY